MRLPRMIKNLVLVKVPKEDTVHGIAMPKDYVEMNIANAGVVAGVGPECVYVNEDDFVFYKSTVGHKIEDDTLPKNYHFIVVAEGDIIGYYKKEDAQNVN